MASFQVQEICQKRKRVCFAKTALSVNSTASDTVMHSALQVWEEVDQGGEDQREADGGSAHRNPVGVCNLHCFRPRQTNFL